MVNSRSLEISTVPEVPTQGAIPDKGRYKKKYAIDQCNIKLTFKFKENALALVSNLILNF